MERSTFWPVKIFIEDSFLPFCMADSKEEAIQKIKLIREKGGDIFSIKASGFDFCGREIELKNSFLIDGS